MIPPFRFITPDSRQSSGQSADRVSAVSARGIGQRRGAALEGHVPDDVKSRTKPEIALRQIRAALMAGVARGVVLTDAAYGSDGGFRAGVTEMGLIYAVAVQSTISVWPPGMEPLPPKPWSGRG